MTIVQRMRAELPRAMKAKDTVRVQFLRYWIAQGTLGDGTELSDDQAVKRMRGIVKEARTGLTSFRPEELALIQDWVPATLSRDHIREALLPIAETLRNAPREGIAMGLAMKQLAGLAVDSEDVSELIAELRS